MKKIEKDGLIYYQSELLEEAGFANYFFTRAGGVSQGDFAELNLSFRVGDDPSAVQKNLEKVQNLMGARSLVTVKQMHKRRVLELTREDIDQERLRNQEADALITGKPGIGLGVLCADCYPLVLAEPEQRLAGIAHCGRKGILEGVVENTVKAIIERGGRRERIVGAIGPGICGECYQVSSQVIVDYQKRFPFGEGKIWAQSQGFYFLKLKSAIFSILAQMGVSVRRIEDLGLCTFEEQEFFSHRRSQGKTGRQLSVIMIKS